MTAPISGTTVVAAVAGAPIAHSLSPLIHNAWIAAAGLDAVYVALRPPADGFAALARGLRGGVIAGLNVTAPFKHDALAVADRATRRARRAGAANLLIFEANGDISADNTDGEGLMEALTRGAPGFDPADGPVVIFGAGGAARGAAAAFLDAGAPAVRLVNRSPD
ncbi:MAG TPA: shikimate dehydrogenase, partial [Caulobacteraceae bacterium]